MHLLLFPFSLSLVIHLKLSSLCSRLNQLLESIGAALFADDTSLSCHGNTSTELETKLNIDLHHIYNWLLANKLTLNKDKTEYIIVGFRQRLEKIDEDPNIEIGQQLIKHVDAGKVPGVIINEQMKRNKHLDK